MKRLVIFISLLTLCIYFGIGSMTPTQAGQPDSVSQANYDAIYWESVKDSNDIRMFRSYLKKFPNGIFAELAKIQIEHLENAPPSVISASGDPKKSGISIPKAASLLRAEPKVLEETEIKVMVKKHNFYDWHRNNSADFKNDFKDNNDGTVTDQATGLIWEKSGSWRKITRKKADNYVGELNRKKLAGRTNWRLPTVEELASLIENKPSGKHGYYIDPVFDKAENGNWLSRCWTADTLKPFNGADEAAWLVDFKKCSIVTGHWNNFSMGVVRSENHFNYVRAVSSKVP